MGKAKFSTGYQRPSDDELEKRLSAEEWSVTREEGTEPPFANRYWNNHQVGVYLDIVSGEPLFSSLDKFESGTGWPSFSKPLPGVQLQELEDHKIGRPGQRFGLASLIPILAMSFQMDLG